MSLPTNSAQILSVDRAAVARSASAKLRALAPQFERTPALIGFDGFIDSIIRPVATRHDMSPHGFTRQATIPEFAARCGAAAGKSTNIELVVEEQRFGGNGPLMASAVGRVGLPVTYVGAVGSPGNASQLHPIFRPFADRCREVVPVAAPGLTDALEFDDGKIMLGKPASLQEVSWTGLQHVLGRERLIAMFDRARLIGIVNWVMMGAVGSIWEGLTREVFPALSKADRRVFIDLCDPAKRTSTDIAHAMEQIRALDRVVPVTLGLNLSEAEQIARVLGVDAFAGSANRSEGQAVRGAAIAIREKLGIACVVVHPREGAGAAQRVGGVGNGVEAAWIDGPFISHPKLSTGAGDHFNGGFALAQSLGLSLPECLATGVAVSGSYVRDAGSPTLERLTEFLGDLPSPERD
ncbi:MAG: hypothetical protein SFY95_00885 [Planctomycetota bacterium]|nr:hypothetical protein [Planctomycetota bacterium]